MPAHLDDKGTAAQFPQSIGLFVQPLAEAS